MFGRPILWLVAMLALVAAPAAAQTRAELIQQQRAEKAAHLQPYQPGKVEAALFRIEHGYLMERIFNPPRGLFVRFGGLPQGAGLGVGPAYRRSNHTTSLTGTSVISLKGYWELDAKLSFPHLAGDRAFVDVGARRRSLPQEDFFGLGEQSRHQDQTAYALRESMFDATVGVKPVDWFSAAVTAGYRTPRIGRGTDKRFPSTQDLFDDATAPGLVAQPDFGRLGVRTTLDYTDRPLGPLSGGRYTVTYDKFSDQDLDRYSFNQWSVDLQQYVPIVAGARSFVLRAYATGVKPTAGHEVPFYFQPTLGGPYSLRGLQAYRLRDRNLLLLQAEYRFELNAFMTGAVFYDAGKVAFRASDLNLSNLEHDVGFGLRLGFMSAVSLRTEVAFGGNGMRLIFKFNDVF